MRLIQGRDDSLVTLRNGAVLAQSEIFEVIEGVSEIVEWLVVQEDYDLIDVKLVVPENDGSRASERVGRGRVASPSDLG